MKKISDEDLELRARNLKELWFDVDGVMTPQGSLVIYDLSSESGIVFERYDGVRSVRLVPCDEHGKPLQNVVEYLAGRAEEPIFEGYRYDTRDGKVIEIAVKSGLRVFFVSGRNSPAMSRRAVNLGAIPHLGIKDKAATIVRESRCIASERCFVGDGIQDVGALRETKDGLAVAPADEAPEAHEAAHWITEARGGEGVIHEVLRVIFAIRGIEVV